MKSNYFNPKYKYIGTYSRDTIEDIIALHYTKYGLHIVANSYGARIQPQYRAYMVFVELPST